MSPEKYEKQKVRRSESEIKRTHAIGKECTQGTKETKTVSFVVSIGWLALMSQSHRKLFKSENATNSEKRA